MPTCALCGREKTSGTNHTVYTGAYLRGSSTYTQLSGSMQQVTSKYHAFLRSDSFVCNTCTTITEIKNKFVTWQALLGYLVVTTIVFYNGLSNSPYFTSDGLLFPCGLSPVLGVGFTAFVYWILGILGIDKTVIDKLKKKAEKAREKISQGQIISAFSEEEYNKMQKFTL